VNWLVIQVSSTVLPTFHDPEFVTLAGSNVGTWHFASSLTEPILEGLRKAGLEIPVAA
jgi:hypothetical protein